MSSNVNQEVVNDTARLMVHRLAARAVARDPALVERARSFAALIAERYPDREFVAQWDVLLRLHADQIRSRLTCRDREMYALRLSSPFVFMKELGLTDDTLRRRIRRAAKRIVERREFRAGVSAGFVP